MTSTWHAETDDFEFHGTQLRISGLDTDPLHGNHPILLFQHLIWHEAYHHGQIKLALKVANLVPDDREIARGTWGVWMRKT